LAKQFEANEDWIKRNEGRIPTKGAAASQRASAGLGVLTDDDALVLAGFTPEEIRRNYPSARKSNQAQTADA
jgi:hypothetical protein